MKATGKKRALGSDLKKVDRHVVQPHEYDEVPELTDEMFERADLHEGGKPVRAVPCTHGSGSTQ